MSHLTCLQPSGVKTVIFLLCAGGIVSLVTAFNGDRAVAEVAFSTLGLIVSGNSLVHETAASIAELLSRLQAVLRGSKLLCPSLTGQEHEQLKLSGNLLIRHKSPAQHLELLCPELHQSQGADKACSGNAIQSNWTQVLLCMQDILQVFSHVVKMCFCLMSGCSNIG